MRLSRQAHTAGSDRSEPAGLLDDIFAALDCRSLRYRLVRGKMTLTRQKHAFAGLWVMKHMARIVQLTTALCFVLGIASSAVACPFCDSSTAEQVRAGIFNSDFGYHLGVALAPFPILFAVLFLIYYWPASRPFSDVAIDRPPLTPYRQHGSNHE